MLKLAYIFFFFLDNSKTNDFRKNFWYHNFENVKIHTFQKKKKPKFQGSAKLDLLLHMKII